MPMLFESDVIDAVCAFLQRGGYDIRQKLGPTERGDDIIAVKPGAESFELRVEAKGETSSKSTTRRYGKPFGSAQIRVHVAEALYKAATVVSTPSEHVDTRAGIALPSTQKHRRLIAQIEPVLRDLEIAVFFASEDGAVDVLSPWQL